MRILGGCAVRQNLKFKYERNLLANNKNYFYEYHVSSKNYQLEPSKETTFTIFIIKNKPNSNILIKNKKYSLKKGMSFDQIKNKKINIDKKDVEFILVGSLKKNKNSKLKVTSYSKHYKVNKPWGYELWINGDKSKYVLKEIVIKKSFQTSLQYHRQKTETNMIFDGSAKLVFRKKRSKTLENTTIRDLSSIKLKNVSLVDVKPYNLHRIKALTNIKLYEASTNHLDDVVRIMDDSNRKSGRIQSEHKK